MKVFCGADIHKETTVHLELEQWGDAVAVKARSSNGVCKYLGKFTSMGVFKRSTNADGVGFQTDDHGSIIIESNEDVV